MTYLAEIRTCLSAKTCLKLSNDSFIKAVHSFKLSKKNYKKANRYLINYQAYLLNEEGSFKKEGDEMKKGRIALFFRFCIF